MLGSMSRTGKFCSCLVWCSRSASRRQWISEPLSRPDDVMLGSMSGAGKCLLSVWCSRSAIRGQCGQVSVIYVQMI